MGLSLRAQGLVIFPATISMNPTILAALSWDTPCCTHIPTKSCAPSIPVLIILLLTHPLAKTNIDGEENTTSVPTNVMTIVASSTHRKQKDNRTQKNFLTSQFPTYIFVQNCIYLTIWNLSDRSVSNLPLIDWLIDWLIDCWLIAWFRQTQEWVNLKNMEIPRLEVFYMSKIFSFLEGKS